jgi:hypothetical protein
MQDLANIPYEHDADRHLINPVIFAKFSKVSQEIVFDKFQRDQDSADCASLRNQSTYESN